VNLSDGEIVADLRPYRYKNVLLVMALPMSGGTRLKVLEGMSMAKAVSPTSVGFDVLHREHVLIVDEPRGKDAR
jgi:polysaccharide biosynthesis protein PslH